MYSTEHHVIVWEQRVTISFAETKVWKFSWDHEWRRSSGLYNNRHGPNAENLNFVALPVRRDDQSEMWFKTFCILNRSKTKVWDWSQWKIVTQCQCRGDWEWRNMQTHKRGNMNQIKQDSNMSQDESSHILDKLQCLTTSEIGSQSWWTSSDQRSKHHYTNMLCYVTNIRTHTPV